MMFTGSQTLTSQLLPGMRSFEERPQSARNPSTASVAKMKAMDAARCRGGSAMQLARRSAGEAILDVKLAQDADAAGKTLRRS